MVSSLLFVVLFASVNDGEVIRLRSSRGGAVETVRLGEFKLVEQERNDLQYERRAKFRGVPLDALLARLGGAGPVLAHFANGMIVPLPDEKGRKRLDILVASEVWDDSNPADVGYKKLPPASKSGAKNRDVRPTQFSGNKWVVRERWHPLVPAKATAIFTPWIHIDSLVELERTSEEVWAQQFPTGNTPLEKKGRELFDQRCRFCHGVGRVGASFGWDFRDPIPLHTYRSKESLFMHVRHRAGDAPEKGYLMPQLSDLTPKDAEAVWEWMSSLSHDAGAH